MVVDPGGNVYITGAISFDYGTLKYSSDGTQQWVMRYDYNGNFDVANSIAIDVSGNAYVTGFSSTASLESSRDYATVKYSSSGSLLWVERYTGSAGDRDEANAIALDASGNVYVTGYVTENSGMDDYGTIKYSQLLGIKNISGTIPDNFSLGQNYPNPFNPKTIISFGIPSGGFVTLKIYDNLGREIAVLVKSMLKPGVYEADWDASNYPSGVYYYRLATGSYAETKKMTLIK
jgi:hypothetical protein